MSDQVGNQNVGFLMTRLICKTVLNRLRDMQYSWLSTKAETLHTFADRKDLRKFHDALKTVYVQKSSEAHFSQIKMISWKGGQYTSIACSIGLQLLLAHLSRRLIGELIVYQWSGVRRPSVGVVHNAQRSSPPKPLGRSKPNVMWSLLG